jgi:hypothetical protein
MIAFFANIFTTIMASKILKISIAIPILYFITNFIQNEILSMISGVIIPTTVLQIMKYFYFDKAISIFLSFVQLKSYMKFFKVWLKIV